MLTSRIKAEIVSIEAFRVSKDAVFAELVEDGVEAFEEVEAFLEEKDRELVEAAVLVDELKELY